jgi:hypothetical protein
VVPGHPDRGEVRGEAVIGPLAIPGGPVKRTLCLLLAPALMLLASACGDDDAATADAIDAVCDQRDEVGDDLAALVALDPAVATADDYESVLDDLESSIDDLRDARGDLVEQDVDNVTATFDDLRSDLEGLDDVPVAEVSDEVSADVTAAATELEGMYQTAYASSSCAE